MIELAEKISIGSAHGKLILVGEHAVVYGKPAIALPFPILEAVATVERISGQNTISCDYYVGPIAKLPKKLQGIASCINETLKQLNKPQNGLLIRIHSSIPIGRGLGSSAAIALAIVKSIYSFFDQKVEQRILMSLVHLAETVAHGNPSGIDMAAASSDIPIWFQKGKSIETLQIGEPLYVVVADTGRFGDTHSAVASVKDAYLANREKMRKSINILGEITLEVRRTLSKGDTKMLGRQLNLAQDELIELGVSDEGINRLIAMARNAGALGAKLTGGGRGGCILALAKNTTHAQTIANTLQKNGATNTWCFKLDRQDNY
jgi:mevalonate kinase